VLIEAAVTTTWRPRRAVAAALTLASLGRGRRDPCHRVTGDGAVWRTSRTQTGPVTYRVAQRGPSEIDASAWGPGAAELIDGLPALLGSDDDDGSFEPRHPLLHKAFHRLPGLRVPRTGRVIEALIPAVIEQRVLGVDARAAWCRLVARHGEAAPGPAPDGMRVPPTAKAWAGLQSWEWHLAGVDPGRASTARAGASVAHRLEECVLLDRPAAYRRLQAVPGIGLWTAAEVGARAFGDADAVSLGDYHLPGLIGHALAGHPLSHDEVEPFLEPWRPHRYRVVRLLELTPGAYPPRRGPRRSRPDFRQL